MISWVQLRMVLNLSCSPGQKWRCWICRHGTFFWLVSPAAFSFSVTAKLTWKSVCKPSCSNWLVLSFPTSKNEITSWESEVLTQLYMFLMTDSACPQHTTTFHCPTGMHFPSFLLCCPDHTPAATISSEILPSLPEPRHNLELTWAPRIENEARNPSLFLFISTARARLQHPWAYRWQQSLTSLQQLGLCLLLALQFFAAGDIVLPMTNLLTSHPNHARVLEIALVVPYAWCPKVSGCLEMIFSA